MKTYQRTLLGAGLLIALVYQTGNGQTKPSAPTTQQLERGRYVVEIGGCNDCHTAGYAEAAGYSTSGASPDGAGYAEAAPDPSYPAYPAGSYGEAASYPNGSTPNGSTYSGTAQPTVPTFTPTFTPSGPAAPGYPDGAGHQAGYQAGYPEGPQAAAHPATPTFTPLSQAEQAQRGYWSGDPRSGDPRSGDPRSGDPQTGRDSREQGYARRR